MGHETGARPRADATPSPPVAGRRGLRAGGKSISQQRSRQTYDTLIDTGFKLLENQEFDSITIAKLTRTAGYSVGAFYSRFSSKDEFFDALLAHHIEHRNAARKQLFESLSDDELIGGLIGDLVAYYWKRRLFWRAALIRSIRDPEPLRVHADEFVDALVKRLSVPHGKPLTEDQERHVRYAMQIALGTINNAIIYGSGPVFARQAEFVDNLVRAFRLVSGYDELVR